MNEKGRQTKLLAAIAVLAMVVCVFVVVMPSDVSADPVRPTEANDPFADVSGIAYDAETGVYTVTGQVTVTLDPTKVYGTEQNPMNVRFVIPESGSLTFNGPTATDGTTVEPVSMYVKYIYDGTFSGADSKAEKSVVYGGENGSEKTFGDFIVGSNVDMHLEIGKTAGNTVTNNYHIFYNADVTVNGGTLTIVQKDAGVDGVSAYYQGTYGNITLDSGSLVFDEAHGVNTAGNGMAGVNVDLNKSKITINNTLGTTAWLNINTGDIDADSSVTVASGTGFGVYASSSLTNAGTIDAGDATFTIKSGATVNNTGTISCGNYNPNGTITGNAVQANGETAVNTSDKTAAEAALSNSEVDVIVYTGSKALTTDSAISKPLIVNDAGALSNVTLAENGSVQYSKTEVDGQVQTYTFSKTVTVNGGNGSVTFGGADDNAFSASYLKITYGSVEVEVEDAAGLIQFDGTTGMIHGTVSGAVTISNTGTTPATVTADGPLTFLNGSSLTIGTGVTFNAGSYIALDKNATNVTITNNGTLAYNEIPDGIKIANNGTLKIDGAQGTENIISTDQPIEGTYYLTGDTTIEEGVTVTIGRNATLDLMGYDLIVKGKLIIERNGVITSSFSDESNASAIVLTRTGSIENNNGIIGDKMPIKVANGEVGIDAETNEYIQYVEMWGVSGVNFEFVREVTFNEATQQNVSTYNMAVSGDISRISGVDTHELTLMNVDISADMTIGNNVYFYINGETVVDNDVTFTNNGAYMEIAETGGVFKLLNGATAVINAITDGTISADIGQVDYGNNMVATEPDTASVDFTVNKSGTDNADMYGVVGMTISVGRVTLSDPTDSTKSIVEQRIYVSGSLDVELNYRLASGANSPIAPVDFTGPIYVSDSLYIPADVRVNESVAANNEYYFDVDDAGTITVAEDGSDLDYSGARYVIETTDNNVTVETTYYTTFAAAMEQIASVQDGVIFISGDYEISGIYEVGDEQEIDIDANRYDFGDATDSTITVAEDGQITVAEDGTISNTAFDKIEGRVIVLAGTGYRPAPNIGIYAVVTVDAETNDTTYSGFKIALDNAAPGQTITVVDTAEYDGNMVIPAQVTVVLDDEVQLTVLGNVTVEAEGTLNLNSGAVMNVGDRNERNYTITVSGTLDASEGGSIGKTTGCTGDVDLYSTGTTTVANANSITNVNINSAYYNDGDYVYTSVANAVAYAEENALASINAHGTFTEAGAVESDGVRIIIDAGADVTLGNVTLSNASIGGEGDYTATVSGLTGTGDVTSTVSVTKTSTTITSSVSMDATGASTYTLSIDALDGNTTVSAGTVEFTGETINATRNNALTISSGATLLIPESNSSLNVSGEEYLSNEGTITIDGVATVIGNTTLSGDVVVAEDGRLIVPGSTTTLTVTGDLVVETDGSMSVSGILIVGEVPDLLGQTASGTVSGTVGMVGNAYALVFTGASVADAEFTSNGSNDVSSTAYTINGIGYATIYTLGDVGITGIDSYVREMKDLTTYKDLVDPADITWYAGETEIINQTVGQYTEVSTDIRYNSVYIQISVGSQISIVVDGVVYGDSARLPFTIGTHQVSAIVNPGFTGDVTITFNGQTVTNGQIEITSDMIDSIDPIVLSATGNITQDSTVVVNGGSNGDDGLGLTDILLIILVILIVVMAIIVALRLMRS